MDKLWLGLDNENKHNCIFLWSDVCLLSAQNDNQLVPTGNSYTSKDVTLTR